MTLMLVVGLMVAGTGAGPLAAEPILGLEFEALTPALAQQEAVSADAGAMVRSLQAGGPAAHAGLRVGDVIQSVNGLPIDAVHGLAQAVLAMHPGGVLELAVWRDGEALTVRVELTPARADEQA
jgi:S1-C subfamily serine protease